MGVPTAKNEPAAVALLAEGVDRNYHMGNPFASFFRSPSSRRAWIEISSLRQPFQRVLGRPPRGGRG